MARSTLKNNKLFLGNKFPEIFYGGKKVTIYKGNELIYPINNTSPLKIIKVVRSSQTEYTLSGSGTGTIYVKNIDTNTITAFQHDFTKALIYPHNKGEKFEFSTDGSDWKNAWGIYFNGTDAYLEGVNGGNISLNSNGKVYRKLEFYRLIRARLSFWTYYPINGATEFLAYNYKDFRYLVNNSNYSKNKLEIEELNFIELKFNSNNNSYDIITNVPEYNINNITQLDSINITDSLKIRIGYQIRRGYYQWLNATISNITLGENIGQMIGQGTQIINQNGEPFLNLKGGAEWVKV